MEGRMKQILLLLALGKLGKSFPMAPPEASPQCICSGGESAGAGLGWSSLLDRCIEGEVTSCRECPWLARCATIRNIGGNGIQLFYGDCRSSAQTCVSADESSIAFAVSLAIDEMDNIYFSDQGNNRIRMLDNSRNAIVTIAGSGESGFAGDGGPARLAQLRKPEGLALKPGLSIGPDNVGRELYFADFVNQRIRKLVRTADDWIIYTVAGNGVMADDPLCDSGCPPLEASLWNPRSLAFASNQDLYFVDSGSHKIRRVTTSSGDPQNNLNATITRFLGHSEWTTSQEMWQSFRGIAKVMLPGHFESPNEYLHLRAMYAITIDKHDRLWTIDSENNRIFMAPLVNLTRTRLAGDFGNFLARLTASMFTDNSTQVNTTAEDRQAQELTWANNLKAWLPLEFPNLATASSMQVETSDSLYKPGRSYWMYGAPVAKETWCPRRQVERPLDSCEPTAQMARFNGLMGMCLDKASNMYLVDTEDSQIVFLDTDNFKDADPQASSSAAATSNGCHCMQYWVALEEENNAELYLPGSFVRSDYLLDILRCKENPGIASLIEQLPTPVLNITEEVLKSASCSTQDYCGRVFSDTYPKWCYTETRSMPEGEQQRMCSNNRWLWCDAGVQDYAPASWRFVPGATIIGNEKRFETRYYMDLINIRFLRQSLTEDLWLTAGSPYEYATNVPRQRSSQFFLGGTAILKGFVDIGTGPCSDYCCGLPIISPFDRIKNKVGYVCGFLSANNITILESYFPESNNTGPGLVSEVQMLTVWEELESLVFDDKLAGNVQSTLTPAAAIEFCKSRCEYDSTCSGFMVKGVNDDDPELLSEGQPCIFFNQNYPFYVYSIGRSSWPFNSIGEVNMSEPTERAEALNAFVGPGVPASRMLGDPNGTYVASESSLVVSRNSIAKAKPEKALLLMDCQELCLQDVTCKGIAFPGCYLLKTDIKLLQASSMTSVYIKETMQPEVKPVAGYSEADAYTTGALAFETYLNKPFSCAVDSKGDLLVSDGLNQRLRKIQGYNSHCSTSGHFTSQQVKDFERLVRDADAACSNESAPQLVDIYARAQAEVVENGSVQLVQDEFCNFGSSPTPAMANYTSNLFVLCQVCQELQPRPAACPWPELCLCRNAMMQVALSAVYIHCPQRNAFVDPWHRWVTAITSCLLEDPQAAQWYNSSQLQQHLQTI